jgi:hypothetical protein
MTDVEYDLHSHLLKSGEDKDGSLTHTGLGLAENVGT